MNTINEINKFFAQKNYAIIGVSKNKKKFGNAIFKELHEKYTIYQIHSSGAEINNKPTYKTLEDLPEKAEALFVCVKPEKTMDILKQAIDYGIKYIWLQQSSENDEIMDYIKNQTDTTIIYKQCALMFAESSLFIHKFHKGLKKLFGKYPKEEDLKVVQ